MKIGIVGTGSIGATFAHRLTVLGHGLTLTNSRGPAGAADLVDELGPNTRAGTVADTTRAADLVILAVPFGRIRELDPTPFTGVVVVDPMNHDPYRDPPDPRIAGARLPSGSPSPLPETTRGPRRWPPRCSTNRSARTGPARCCTPFGNGACPTPESPTSADLRGRPGSGSPDHRR